MADGDGPADSDGAGGAGVNDNSNSHGGGGTTYGDAGRESDEGFGGWGSDWDSITTTDRDSTTTTGWGSRIGSALGGLALSSLGPLGAVVGKEAGGYLGDQVEGLLAGWAAGPVDAASLQSWGDANGVNVDIGGIVNGGEGSLYTGNNWTPTNTTGGATLTDRATTANPTAGMTTEQAQAYWASQAALQNTTLNRPNQNTPFGSQTWTQDAENPNKWTSDITLSPQQQALQDAQDNVNLQKSDLASRLAEYLRDGGVSNTWTSDAGLQKDIQLGTTESLGTYVPKAATAGSAEAGSGSINLNGMTALPEVSDATRQRVEDALYQRSTSRLDPIWAQRQDALAVQLANQGITLGSGAYDTSVGQFGRDRNDAYQLALNEAIVGGGTEQSRLFDLALKPRQQEFAERSKAADVSLSNAQMQTNAQIANANNATQVAIANALREIEAAKLNSQNTLDLQNANNAAILNQATFGNNAKLGEMAANNSAIDQLFNTVSQMSNGSGPTLPTFQSGMSGANVSTVNSADIQNQLYNRELAKDNADTASDNALYGVLGGLASDFVGSFF